MEKILIISGLVGIFLGLPLLYVWKAKHPQLNLWNAYARFIVLAYAGPFIVGFLMAVLTDFLFAYEVLPRSLQLNSGVQGLFKWIAVFLSLPTIYLSRSLIQTVSLPWGGSVTAKDSRLPA